MTSKDKDAVSLPVSPWDAILKAAKDQLPSMDSDSSLSDCEEEEPFIFQRKQPVLIPDLAEELAEDPVDVDGSWVAVGRSSSPEQLEDWDLDYILQSLPGQQDSQGDGAPRTAWWLADHWQNQGHTTRLSEDTLLEQLGLLCATQSRVHNPTWKISADKLLDTQEQEARSSTSADPGFQTEPVQKMAESRKLKTEPPTIFIDLRQTESSEPREQSQERDCTGKSQLLQQLRAFRKGIVPPQLSASDNPGGQKAQAPENPAGSQTGRKKYLKLWETECPGLGDLLGTQPAREELLPATGQLWATQTQKHT